ncbi:MAG: hypothetical protein QW046_05050 [Candidatus Micrarchaeaceae archaeon]
MKRMNFLILRSALGVVVLTLLSMFALYLDTTISEKYIVIDSAPLFAGIFISFTMAYMKLYLQCLQCEGDSDEEE